MKQVATLLLVALLGSGCISAGRFAVVDLDLRSPEQIVAGEVEAAVIYGAPATSEEPVEPVANKSWMRFLAPIIEVFDGRLRILSFEWRE